MQSRDRRAWQGPSRPRDRRPGRPDGASCRCRGIQFRLLNRRRVRRFRVRAPRPTARLCAAIAAMVDGERGHADRGRRSKRCCPDAPATRVTGVRLADGREISRPRDGGDDRHLPGRHAPLRRGDHAGRARRRGAEPGPRRRSGRARASTRPDEDRHAAASRRRGRSIGARLEMQPGDADADDVLGARHRTPRCRNLPARSRGPPRDARDHPRQPRRNRRCTTARSHRQGPRYCPSIEDKIAPLRRPGRAPDLP